MCSNSEYPYLGASNPVEWVLSPVRNGVPCLSDHAAPDYFVLIGSERPANADRVYVDSAALTVDLVIIIALLVVIPKIGSSRRSAILSIIAGLFFGIGIGVIAELRGGPGVGAAVVVATAVLAVISLMRYRRPRSAPTSAKVKV